MAVEVVVVAVADSAIEVVAGVAVEDLAIEVVVVEVAVEVSAVEVSSIPTRGAWFVLCMRLKLESLILVFLQAVVVVVAHLAAAVEVLPEAGEEAGAVLLVVVEAV